MPKFDCTKTLNFITELDRMCKSYLDCIGCPLHTNVTSDSCMLGIRNNPEETLIAVQEWSDEHPIETYMEDFLKAFPNAPTLQMNMVGSYPSACRANIYGEISVNIELCKKYNYDCYSCWNAIKKEENI